MKKSLTMNLKNISRWHKVLFFSITALGISSIITQLRIKPIGG